MSEGQNKNFSSPEPTPIGETNRGLKAPQPIGMTVIKDGKRRHLTLMHPEDLTLVDPSNNIDPFRAVDDNGRIVGLNQTERYLAYELIGLTPPQELTNGLYVHEKIGERKRKKKTNSQRKSA